MSMEMSTTRGISSRQAATIAGAGVLGVALSAALVWAVMASPADRETVKRSADETRLLGLAEREKARAAAQVRKLRQSDVGQGMRFDAEGNLIEAMPESLSDVPQNKALDEAAGGPPPRDEIAQGIVRARKEAPRAEMAPDPAPEDDLGWEQESRSGEAASASAASEGEADPKASMLGYSTVRSASWATRRPESPDERRERTAAKSPEAQEDATMERAIKVMEDSVRMDASGGRGGPQGGMPTSGPMLANAGMWSNAPQVSPGPSSRGESLYAEDGGTPAERGPQMFAPGGIGDMRIGGNVGPDHVVRQGKFLDCVLVTRLRADLVDSPVIAMVSRDFVSLDGKYVLVPAGTKLLGSAGSVGNLQQARVYMKFDRLIYPDQRAAFFPIRKVSAVDGEGAVGIPGDVDRHFALQFGAAVMLGMLDGLAAAVQGQGAEGQPTVRELVAARTSTNLSTVVAGVIQKYGNVVPTITVEPGASMKIFFAEDVRVSPYLTTSELSWLRGRR
jgi:type IV secretory pathway VirB10-like protein